MNRRSAFLRTWIAAIITVLAILSARPAGAASIDPALRFRTLETDHFLIHYHQQSEATAHRAAGLAEEVHGKVVAAFRWTPREKTQLVLIDSSDLANGFTTVLPYNMIYVYLVPPQPDSTIGEYVDWLRTVILHEYVHVVTMDAARGFSEVTRAVFGKPVPGADWLSFLLFLVAAPPNVFMPDWWLEGTATWGETEFTPVGRGRSSYYEMIFRMAVLENNIPRVDQINGDVPFWPDGHIPYAFGMLMEKYIARTYGTEAVGKISIAQAGRLPFFIGGTAQRYTGKDYPGVYRDMVAELTGDHTQKAQYLRSVPLTEHRAMPFEGERLHNPRLSPDGRYLAFDREDPHRHYEVVIADAATLAEVRTFRRLYSDRSKSWSPDGRRLYYTEADLRGAGGYNLFQDIYVYDMAKDSTRRVTTDLRAKDIDVSPDGNTIAFVKIENMVQRVALLDLTKDKDTVTVLGSFENAAVTGLRWSPDGRSIVFSKREDAGQVSIELCDVAARTFRTLVKDASANVYPAWTPDGSRILFTSDRTGVYNLFAYALADGTVLQVTHVLGGAFEADMERSRDRIIFSAYHSKGYYLAEMPYDPSGWMKQFSPEIRPLWGAPVAVTGGRTEEKGQVLPASAAPAQAPAGSPSPAPSVSSSGQQAAPPPAAVSDKGAYSPWGTILPRFWLPTLISDNEGPVVGAFTAGQDILGYHAYYGQVQYGTDSRQGYFDAYYLYDRWYPTFYLWGYSQPVQHSNFFNNDTDYWERRTDLTAGIILPLVWLEKQYYLTGGYTYEKVEHLDEITGRTVDGLPVFEGRRDNVFVGAGYRGTLKYPYSVSREEGRNISLLYKNYSRALGGDLCQREYSATYDEYLRVFGHQVLYLNLRGATQNGDLIAQQAFPIGGTPLTGNDYPLRGFEQGTAAGSSIVTGTLEYRFPLAYVFHGWNTKPFYLDRVHGALFVDAGNVWGNGREFNSDDTMVGVGVELRADVVLGYKLALTPAIGFAQGVTDHGKTQVYLTIYARL